jgi:hypothetical protein
LLWHAELLIECFLLALLWYRDAPQWFCILIGTDCISQLSQIIFYRGGYPEFARLVSRAGYLVIGCCCCLALIEAANLDSGRLKFWHIRIFAFWVTGAKLCGWMEVGQPDAVIFWWNGWLLTVQGVAFAAWIWLFAGSKLSS